jgi:hypothetical protein
MELAALVADEQDPEKLSELVKEIDQLLAEKQDRLGRTHFLPNLRSRAQSRWQNCLGLTDGGLGALVTVISRYGPCDAGRDA